MIDQFVNWAQAVFGDTACVFYRCK